MSLVSAIIVTFAIESAISEPLASNERQKHKYFIFASRHACDCALYKHPYSLLQ